MTWPIRDRRDLIARLVDHAAVARGKEEEGEEEDDSDPEDRFLLLDRPTSATIGDASGTGGIINND